MPQASWLFIKDRESIWIERPHGNHMVVAGPGSAREEHDFPDEDAVQAFQIAIGEKLTAEGWFLWGFDRERRTGRDRRTAARTQPDRRRPLASERRIPNVEQPTSANR
jgi:hypothetical protein